jgi:copper chaperone CopZ
MMETCFVVVKNMMNQDDANKVLEAIERVWGLGQVEVNLSKKEAKFTYDERMASLQDFEQAIKDTGFEITH